MATQKETTDFEIRLAESAAKVVAFLDDWLVAEPKRLEAGRPARLVAAMRHGVLNGGKRFRPFLVLECARLVDPGFDRTAALHVAAAIEAIHCYSLVHDDLPAMDDDDLRRGKPTVHIAYDEAEAILAGDGLLTEAFSLVTAHGNGLAAETKCEIIHILARDAGVGGMVGGQSLDLANEHRTVDADTITMTQALKTGALIRASCEIGAVLAGADDASRSRLRQFGAIIGLTFQIADDLLDVTADAATLGKAAGKDAQAGKQTLVSLNGVDWARQRLSALVAEAERTVSSFGQGADVLRQAARFVAERSN